MIYTIGDIAVIEGTFLDRLSREGLTLDSMELRIQPPDGATEIDVIGISNFANLSPGIYTYNQFLTVSGVWRYRFVTNGIYAAACEGSLTVRESPFSFPP